MNKFNFNPFADTYTKVTIPLDDKVIAAFESSERYSHLLNDFNSANSNNVYTNVYCTITIAFDFESMETFFSINTICTNDDLEVWDETNDFIDFDPITAEYFKKEALKYLSQNLKAMDMCKAGQLAVSV